jgi:hypothetical protein
VLLVPVFTRFSAILAYLPFSTNGDVRWTIGSAVILASWPYAYFVMVPVNVWLYAIPPGRAVSTVRKLMREWGLLEWGNVLAVALPAPEH